MNEHNHEVITEQEPGKKRASRRRFLIGLLAGTLLGGVAAGAVSVHSQMGSGRWFHGGPCAHGRVMDPESVAQRVDFVSDWILKRVNATEDQQQKIKVILKDTLNDLFPLGEQHRQNRQVMMEILLQPTVDRDALNRIRQSEMVLAEKASSRLLDAVAGAADVLTMEQRQDLANLAHKMHH